MILISIVNTICNTGDPDSLSLDEIVNMHTYHHSFVLIALQSLQPLAPYIIPRINTELIGFWLLLTP